QDRANLYTKAHNVAHWTATFCDRNEKTCEHGAELRDIFLEKASFAAASAYEIALVQLTGEQLEPSTANTFNQSYRARPALGTLTHYDRQAEWRGRR
ncbi:MAG: hypothetical protein K0U34_01320, partial [Alphaproteobacteria bacterium]|nr:hypothetical protein [Alphaproteobacteria bacterium]